VRISGITVTPRALSRITLFFTVSTAQTITNSTNEALQYRESRNRSRRQLSAALRCSRQSSRNDYAMLFNAELLVLQELLLSSDLFISMLQSAAFKAHAICSNIQHFYIMQKLDIYHSRRHDEIRILSDILK